MLRDMASNGTQVYAKAGEGEVDTEKQAAFEDALAPVTGEIRKIPRGEF